MSRLGNCYRRRLADWFLGRIGFLPYEGKIPRSVIVVTAERVYTQCPRALIRSNLWDPARHLDENALPSQGTMMKAIHESFAAEDWDRTYAQRL